ncbi:hypothetical protein GCM10010413_55960 [Promicromonospora sukumoe]|uniref:LPXTG-motif cell wall-anchored protein n=1 Tax=Promicromonospora sukumoe TaxID=88382 RepID=A0A7W3JDG0_9MICO|nr:hypothetical protein [Promicromonospora sukumoe]MBA8810816.1 hypothetical protein [Promicromonospora sukumoe]
MKKLLAGGTLAVLAFGGMIATATSASAHTPSVSSDCGFVNVDLKYYQDAKVTVVIDGVTVEDTEFNGGFQKRYEENLGLDKAHEWTVTVDAYDGRDGTQYDWSQSGSIGVCQTPPPAEVVTPVVPEAVAGCAASLDDIVLPESTEAITYTKTEAGIVATLNSEDFIWPEELGAYVPQEDGSALLPTDVIVLEEDCEPSPSPSVEPSEEAPAPSDEPTTASPSPAPAETEELAATGATVGGAIAFAALLAAGGVALVWARKRMQQNA